MADDFVGVDEPVTIDKKLQTYSNTVGANTVHAEGVVQVDTAGAPVPLGTAASPVRIDPTGTTAQPVTDNAGTITVDAPVATPVAVRQSDGTAFYKAVDDSKFPATAALADSTANPTLTKIQTFPMVFDGVVWSRLGHIPATGDGQPALLGTVPTFNYLHGFNGTSWDRLRAVGNNADNVAVKTLGVLDVNSHLMEFDGTAWDRVTAIAKAAQLPTALVGGRLDINLGAITGGVTFDVSDRAARLLGVLSAGTNNIGDVDVLSMPVDANATEVQGTVAHGVADANNPVKIGGIARTANPTAVSALQRTDAFFDDVGRQVVVPNQVRDLVTRATTTISTTTETSILTAGAAGVFHDLTLLTVSNTSATDVRVDFRDATAGTIQFSLFVKAGAVVGFSLTTPMTQTAAANNWTAQSSAAVTDLRVLVQAVKNV